MKQGPHKNKQYCFLKTKRSTPLAQKAVVVFTQISENTIA